MTLFSSFSWLNPSFNVKNDTIDNANSREWASSPVPPAVLTSHSSSDESFITAAHVSSFRLPISPEEKSFDRDVEKEPLTPEGLRPRCSIESIRRKIGLPDDLVSNVRVDDDNFTSDCYQGIETILSDVHDRRQQISLVPCTVLPPRICRSSTWGTTQSNSIQSSAGAGSSYSSLYHHNFSSWSSSREHPPPTNVPTAQSPPLSSGQARTAVGATVLALQQQQNISPWYNDSIIYDPRASLDTNVECNGKMEFETMEPVDQNFPLVYSTTPDRAKLGKRVDQTANHFDDDGSSVGASPSSRAGLIVGDTLITRPNDNNVSFSSTSKTIRIAHQRCSSGDVGKAASDVVVPYENCIATEEIILSNRLHNENHFEENSCIAVAKGSFDNVDENDYTPAESRRSGWDEDLLGLKARNQRRVKEELIYSAAERLHDDMKLVFELERLEILSYQSKIRTPTDQEGILLGFRKHNREKIFERIDVLLDELTTGFPLDELSFGVSSQSDEFSNDDSHQDLWDCLVFCKTIVQMIVPDSENDTRSSMSDDQGRWMLCQELLSAVGIRQNTPTNLCRQGCRPHGQGGDTSVFSLPYSAGTPISSNVSVATTLTSAFDQHRNIQNRNRNYMGIDGLQLRETITLLSSVFHQLSMALIDLLSVSPVNASVLTPAVYKIQGCYLQLLRMNREYLRSLVACFEFENRSTMQEEYGVPLLNLPLPTVPSRDFRSVDTISSYDGRRAPQAIRQRRLRTINRITNRFAPPIVGEGIYSGSFRSNIHEKTDFDQENFDVDDLRRHIGSFEYTDIDDKRDQCEEECDDKFHFCDQLQRGNSFLSSCDSPKEQSRKLLR